MLDKFKEFFDFAINIDWKVIMVGFILILLSFVAVCYFDKDHIVPLNTRVNVAWTLWIITIFFAMKLAYLYVEKGKIFKKIDYLGKKERNILRKFAKSNSSVIEIIRDDVTIHALTLSGFFITVSDETPFSPKVRIVLDDINQLKQIKAYFKQ